MIQKVNIFRHIGYNNPQAAYELLEKAGYTDLKKDREYISALLAHYVANGGDKALTEVMSIHPDREAIISSSEGNKITGIKEENGNYLSCAGNCGNCPLKKSADGAATKTDNTENSKISERTINLLIIGGSTVLATTLIALIISNARRS
jgi:hypothetical protein